MRLLIFSCRKKIPTLLRLIRDAQIPHDILCDFDDFYMGQGSGHLYTGVMIEGAVLKTARLGDYDIINALGSIYPTFIKDPEELKQPVTFSYYAGHEDFPAFLEEAQRVEPRPYRSSDRIPLQLKAQIFRDASTEQSLDVQTLNISEAGCALRLTEQSTFSEGAELLLKVQDYEEEVPIPATVCWYSDDGSDFFGVGLRFKDLPKKYSENIKRMILRGIISAAK